MSIAPVGGVGAASAAVAHLARSESGEAPGVRDNDGDAEDTGAAAVRATARPVGST
jgi:hypothetical protein